MSDTTPGIDAAVSEWLAFVVREDGPESAAGLTLLALDTLTARLSAVERERDAARRVVDAARTFRHDIRPGVYVDEVFDAIEVFHAVIDDYDALTADATEGATDE